MLGSLPIASKCQPRRRNSISWLRSSAAFCRASDSLHVLPSQLLELTHATPMVLPNMPRFAGRPDNSLCGPFNFRTGQFNVLPIVSINWRCDN
jgi:hypothetical protein